jgi:hypothetical protein
LLYWSRYWMSNCSFRLRVDYPEVSFQRPRSILMGGHTKEARSYITKSIVWSLLNYTTEELPNTWDGGGLLSSVKEIIVTKDILCTYSVIVFWLKQDTYTIYLLCIFCQFIDLNASQLQLNIFPHFKFFSFTSNLNGEIIRAAIFVGEVRRTKHPTTWILYASAKSPWWPICCESRQTRSINNTPHLLVVWFWLLPRLS